jgi:hypothetical protein
MRRRFHPFVLVLLLIAATSICAPGALAAESIAPSYAMKQLSFPDGSEYTCPAWSGGTDGNGTFYVPCNKFIFMVGADGTYRGSIPLDDTLRARRDAAANIDGSVVYYVSSELILDQPVEAFPTIGRVVRLVRQLDGTYRRDLGFDVGPFDLGGITPWGARNLDVDLAGNLYVSVNAFVYVFNSAGNRVATFGGDDVYEDGVYQQGLEIAQGIAVTPNGRNLYVVEQRRNHIQRWDRTVGGDWIRSQWRLGLLGPAGDCTTTTAFASPYDVGLDGSGSIYVLDTSCRRILKYRISTGAWQATVWSFPTGALIHGLTANWRGNVLVPEQGRMYSFTDLTQTRQCAPDSDAPTFSRMRTSSIVYVPSVTVSLSASDGCSAPRMVQFGGSVPSTAKGWRPYAQNITIPVVGGLSGYRTITATIRDAYGRTASRTIRVFYDRTLRARTTITLSGRESLCQDNPLRSIASRQWKLADRCATFTGTVLSIQRTAREVRYRVKIPTRTARRMFVNATGATPIWVVTNRDTRVQGRIRVGSSIEITSALIFATDRSSVAAAPSWQLVRR